MPYSGFVISPADRRKSERRAKRLGFYVRFQRARAICYLVGLLLGLVIPMIDLPLLERSELTEIPDRLTRLIQKRTLPPPPPVQEKARPEERELEPPEEAPLLAEEGTPQPVSDLPPEKAAASKGILAFREKFAALSEHDSVSQLGAQARVSRSVKPAPNSSSRFSRTVKL